jgi:hypothetical protein
MLLLVPRLSVEDQVARARHLGLHPRVRGVAAERRLASSAVDRAPYPQVRTRFTAGADGVRTCGPSSSLVALALGPTTGN